MSQSDSSWDHLSDHRHCKTSDTHEDLTTSWQFPSRPASPPLDVPETSTSPWQHVSLLPPSAPKHDIEDDREVALRLYRELEGRSFHAPSEDGSEATVQGYEGRPPIRYAVTPPPEPDPMVVDELKAFQWSEGTRLNGFLQCDLQARQSLTAFLAKNGYDPEMTALIAEEMDGAEAENGIGRDEKGAWYFLDGRAEVPSVKEESDATKSKEPKLDAVDKGGAFDFALSAGYEWTKAEDGQWHVSQVWDAVESISPKADSPPAYVDSSPIVMPRHMLLDASHPPGESVPSPPAKEEKEVAAKKAIKAGTKRVAWVADLLKDADDDEQEVPKIRRRKSATDRAILRQPHSTATPVKIGTPTYDRKDAMPLDGVFGDEGDPFDIAC